VATKTRLANKTIWALEDIAGHCGSARRQWRRAMDRAEKRNDAVMMASLARLRDRLAEIERLARDARQGKYETRMAGHSGSGAVDDTTTDRERNG